MSNSYKRTAAYINLNAIVHNVKEVKRVLKPSAGIMAVIKADAYGHGAVETARALDAMDSEGEAPVQAYGVAIVEEGISLRKAGIKKPILLLGFTADEQLDEVIDYGLTQTIYSLEKAEALNKRAVAKGKIVDIHIKIDTGMSRIGFKPCEESRDIILKLAKLPGIRIAGIFSHLACADETDKTSTLLQYKRFTSFVGELENKGLSIAIKHISNSAAVIDMPELNMDMVRLGIATYGMYPSAEVNHEAVRLIPALEWKTHISFVKEIDKGCPVSYGAVFTADRKMRVATIPVGYADGYPRTLSNKGRVLIRGKSARILGRICMDQFMVDVSEIPDAECGDIVTLVGHDGNEFIPIEEPAAMSGSFNYEFACSIGSRVPRVYMP